MNQDELTELQYKASQADEMVAEAKRFSRIFRAMKARLESWRGYKPDRDARPTPTPDKTGRYSLAQLHSAYEQGCRDTAELLSAQMRETFRSARDADQ